MDKYILKDAIDGIDDSFFIESEQTIKREHLFWARVEGFATAVILMIILGISSMNAHATFRGDNESDAEYDVADDDANIDYSNYSFINEYQIKMERSYISRDANDGYFVIEIAKNEQIINAKILGIEEFDDGYMGVRLQLEDNHEAIVFIELYGKDCRIERINARKNADSIMVYYTASQSYGLKRIAVIPGDELSKTKIKELKKYIFTLE